jgi:hypothetical protein
MKKLLLPLFVLALATPSLATPRVVISPDEAMVLVPGLEFVGSSRASTVAFCAKQVGVDDYRDLQTDSEFEGMEACLVEMS